jgi:hypothetical protein
MSASHALSVSDRRTLNHFDILPISGHCLMAVSLPASPSAGADWIAPDLAHVTAEVLLVAASGTTA